MTENEILESVVEACCYANVARLKLFFQIGKACLDLTDIEAKKVGKYKPAEGKLYRSQAWVKVRDYVNAQAVDRGYPPLPTADFYYYSAMKSIDELTEEQREKLIASKTSYCSISCLLGYPKKQRDAFIEKAGATGKPIVFPRTKGREGGRLRSKDMRLEYEQINHGIEIPSETRNVLSFTLEPMEQDEEVLTAKVSSLFSRISYKVIQEAALRCGMNITRKQTQFASLRAS